MVRRCDFILWKGSAVVCLSTELGEKTGFWYEHNDSDQPFPLIACSRILSQSTQTAPLTTAKYTIQSGRIYVIILLKFAYIVILESGQMNVLLLMFKFPYHFY